MKPLSIAVIILTAALALGSCKNHREEPIPGPKALRPAAEAIAAQGDPSSNAAHGGRTSRPSSGRHGASGISWFQGTVEEAFSTTCGKCTTMFLREALER
jgi:hypothetical protein